LETANTFITTTLPYVNSVPHIGHAFEFILGDAISKWLKLRNETKVHFNVGLDEHGLKVWEKSQELGITPEEHVENLTKLWKEFCSKFNIEYDSFYKTSDKSHHEKVQVIWRNFVRSGDIYKAPYKGKYCKGCESAKKDSELVDGRCSDHPTTEIELVEEENYFFKLSKYRETLLKWINETPDFLEPKSKLEELKNLIIGSDDISISRTKEKCPWGVDVPGDDSQVIYVWFDALLNYIFAAGYLGTKSVREKYEIFDGGTFQDIGQWVEKPVDFKWDNVIQLCGPDNLRFQAVIFQAFLEAEGIKKSDKLLVHGTILDKDGRKISKSIGNVIDPIDQLEKFGLDAVRYYALAGLSTYSNSNWSEEELKNLWNADIVNDWGNLVSRVLHLTDIKCGGKANWTPEDSFHKVVDGYTKEVYSLWSEFRVKDALKKTNELVKFANKYINDVKPWASENYEVELSNLLTVLITVNDLYVPLFGNKRSNEILDIIHAGKKEILFSRI
jgi:methionyl-tRNA synthetase